MMHNRDTKKPPTATSIIVAKGSKVNIRFVKEGAGQS